MRRIRTTLVAAGLMLAATGCTGASSTTVAPEPTSTVTPTDGSAGTATTDTDGTDRPQVPESDAGRRLRVTDDGATLVLHIGETVTLIQDDPLSPDPVVKGEAVELVEMVSIGDTGDRQWEIRAVATGSATIEAVDGEVTFRVTVRVDASS